MPGLEKNKELIEMETSNMLRIMLGNLTTISQRLKVMEEVCHYMGLDIQVKEFNNSKGS